MKRSDAVGILRQAGIFNPQRLVQLIQDVISFFQLDLSGHVVLTECASGFYVVTPVIAALAGADRVIGITSDSQYASTKEVIAQTNALEELCNLDRSVEIHTKRSSDLFAEADIVTNLGFVRPIDAKAVSAMKPSVIIALMCEDWELRPGDIDIQACRQHGISVVATNEDYPGLEVFENVGWLCQKMLFDAQIEVYKSNVLVVSSDKLGVVIERHFKHLGIAVNRVDHLRDLDCLSGIDTLVVADYTRKDLIIGKDGDITAEQLAEACPAITVIQFAGRIDINGVRHAQMAIHPGIELPYRRMAFTLAGLGPRPVIELHAAGLKACEITIKNPSVSDSDGLARIISPTTK